MASAAVSRLISGIAFFEHFRDVRVSTKNVSAALLRYSQMTGVQVITSARRHEHRAGRDAPAGLGSRRGDRRHVSGSLTTPERPSSSQPGARVRPRAPREPQRLAVHELASPAEHPWRPRARRHHDMDASSEERQRGQLHPPKARRFLEQLGHPDARPVELHPVDHSPGDVSVGSDGRMCGIARSFASGRCGRGALRSRIEEAR